jgi:carboxymethylenebutenolidase
MGIQTKTIELTTSDGPMAAYEAVPESATGAVIVIQEAFGVNDHIEDVTRRFADVGYHAVAPHLFHRAGGGTAPYDDFSKVMPLFEGVTDQAILVDVDATIAHLKDAGFSEDRIAIVGFCMGGRVTFLVAVNRALGAAAGFYGGGIVTSRPGGFKPLIDRVGDLKTPWLGLFGDLDGGIPIEDVERLRTELAAVATPSDVVRYADAEHGFHCDKRPAYNAEASKDAWGKTLDWFAQHLAT